MCPPLVIYYFSSNFLTILQYACTFLRIFAAKSTLFLFFCTYTFLTFVCIRHYLLPVICRIDKTEPAWIAPCRFRFSCMLLRNCMLDLSEVYSMLVEDVCGYLPAASSRKVMPVLRREPCKLQCRHRSVLRCRLRCQLPVLRRNLRTGLPKSASTRRCFSHRSQTGRYSFRRASNRKR